MNLSHAVRNIFLGLAFSSAFSLSGFAAVKGNDCFQYYKELMDWTPSGLEKLSPKNLQKAKYRPTFEFMSLLKDFLSQEDSNYVLSSKDGYEVFLAQLETNRTHKLKYKSELVKAYERILSSEGFQEIQKAASQNNKKDGQELSNEELSEQELDRLILVAQIFNTYKESTIYCGPDDAPRYVRLSKIVDAIRLVVKK